MDEAMLIFTEMRKHGVSPDVFNYATVIPIRMVGSLVPWTNSVRCFVLGSTAECIRSSFLQMMYGGIHCSLGLFFCSIINNLWKEVKVMNAHDIFDLVIPICERSDVIQLIH
ncbi:hypothetical protein ACQ4PT_057347 [Festuca glaucescens]